MIYFAYGSNMCLGRLKERTPSARFVSIARLQGHDFRFHKVSSDGSAKSDAFRTNDSDNEVWGVVFAIDDEEKPQLDAAEGVGRGYWERPVEVSTQDNIRVNACMYYADADAIDSSFEPYSWYKRFVVEGARQHALPSGYIEAIASLPSKEDPKPERDAKKGAIRCSDLDLGLFPWIADASGWRIASATEATSHWLKHTAGPLDAFFYEERWYRARLLVENLRTAQHMFGDNWPLTKHARLRDLLEANREAVLDGSFPKADFIKQRSEPAAIIVLLDRAGEPHVTDGLGRTFMALWNNLDTVDAYVFDEWSDRPLGAS